MKKHSLLYSSQYGFRQAHSTQHAILDMVETIQTNKDKKLFSCGVFIDLKKGFDTVNHTILLDKINYYDFRVNQWFCSYLSNRRQTTEIGSHISSKRNITCGVPQGPVLFRFTRFLQGQIGLPFSIYNVISGSNESPFLIYKAITESNWSLFFDLHGYQSPFLDFQCFYMVKSVSLCRFSVFLHNIYQVVVNYLV